MHRMFKSPRVKSNTITNAPRRVRIGSLFFSILLSKWTPLLTVVSLFTFHSCGLDVEDANPPSPPQWVEKSLPEAWPERGLDAHESSGIFLEWEASPDEDIVAYHIYRAAWYDIHDSLGNYEILARLKKQTLAGAEYIDEQVETRVKYSYKLKAEDASGNISEQSDSLSYMILPSIRLSEMRPNGFSMALGPERRLSWASTSEIELQDYCITVLAQNNQFLYRERFPPRNYIEDAEDWDIPIEVELTPGEVYQWRIDTGANYHDGREKTGSESQWAQFLFVGE
jgi:hypothetical protein